MKVDGWITFTSPNVLAVRRRDKTETRRAIKPQPNANQYIGRNRFNTTGWSLYKHGEVFDHVMRDNVRCYKVGDILGVKEGYRFDHIPHLRERGIWGQYLADDAAFKVVLTDAEWSRFIERKFPTRATPGRFMYKSLARTFVEVLEVRVERLWDITEEGAIAEGVTMARDDHSWTYTYPGAVGPVWFGTARWAFEALWDSINAKKGHGWNANPVVWAYRFEVTE